MELFQNSISIINESIKLKGESKKYFLHTFKLIDNYLGISNPPVIYGIKIYNNKIMKKYPTFKDGSQLHLVLINYGINKLKKMDLELLL